MTKPINGTKTFKFTGLKVSPSQPTDAQVAMINKFTRRPFKADELYIGQLRLAHNAIDRDNERFSEEVLQRFADTIVRKTMLFDHGKYDSQDHAVGKFFDVAIEKIPLDQASQQTGESLRLPLNTSEVQFLSPWFYIPVKGVSEAIVVKIDAGIYDFASIGFRADKREDILDANGQFLYREYRGTSKATEATEGSLVYLGAQPGASIKTPSDFSLQTSALPDADKYMQFKKKPPVKAFDPEPHSEGAKKIMDKILEKLSALLGRNLTEETATDTVKAFFDEKSDKIKTLEKDLVDAKKLELKVKELEPLAADGKAYRDGLISNYVALKAKMGDIKESPDAQEKVKVVASQYPIDFLKSEVDVLQKRVEEEYPATPQLKGDDRQDKSKGTSVNPLIPV